MFIVPWLAAPTLSGAACASAPRQTSATRWLTSTFPAPTATGGTAATIVPGGRDHLDRPQGAAIGRDGRVGRRPNREGDRADGHRLDGVDVAGTLRVGAGEVEAGALAVDGEREHDAGRALLLGARAGRVEHVVEPVGPVRQRSEAGAHAALAVVDHLVERLAGQLGQPLDTDDVGADLGVEVAAALVGGARRGEQHRDHVVVAQSDGRDAQSLLLDLDRVGRDRPGDHAADVGVVGSVGRPAREASVDPARRHERDVVEMGAAHERVVEDHLLARTDAIESEGVDGGPHRRRHRAEVHGDVLGLHEQLALGGEEGGRAVGSLLDVGAEGGPTQDGAHLLGDTRELGDQDLERRRIHAPPPPTSAVHPSGTHTVQSGSASTAGPVAGRPSTGVRQVLDAASATRVRADTRRATTSTGAPDRA